MREKIPDEFWFSTNKAPAHLLVLPEDISYGISTEVRMSGLPFNGTIDSRWSDTDVFNLRQIKAQDFEVIQLPTVKTNCP